MTSVDKVMPGALVERITVSDLIQPNHDSLRRVHAALLDDDIRKPVKLAVDGAARADLAWVSERIANLYGPLEMLSVEIT